MKSVAGSFEAAPCERQEIIGGRFNALAACAGAREEKPEMQTLEKRRQSHDT
jgi:hypothetical protein